MKNSSRIQKDSPEDEKITITEYVIPILFRDDICHSTTKTTKENSQANPILTVIEKNDNESTVFCFIKDKDNGLGIENISEDLFGINLFIQDILYGTVYEHDFIEVTTNEGYQPQESPVRIGNSKISIETGGKFYIRTTENEHICKGYAN